VNQRVEIDNNLTKCIDIYIIDKKFNEPKNLYIVALKNFEGASLDQDLKLYTQNSQPYK
jgi:hypothetical protein